MNTQEQQYLDLCQRILDEGTFVGDRTNTGCISVIDASMRFDLSKGFPLYTTKKINPLLPIGEMLWILAGKTDLVSLRHYQNKPEDSHTIWSDDFERFWEESTFGESYKKEQDGGFIYGKQLREYPIDDTHGFDQLKELISNIKKVMKDPCHPMGRRLKCEFWNPYDHLMGDKEWAALPACHTGFQCFVRGNKLSLKVTLRSNDVFLGNPFNVAGYAFLTHCLAQLCGLEVGELIYNGSDVHIYSNHVEQVKEQLSREPRDFPKIVMPEFNTLEELLSLTAKDFVIEGYDPHPFIKAPQAS